MTELPIPEPSEVTAGHHYSDVDASYKAQHHTLGTKPTQAAPGNHRHPIDVQIFTANGTWTKPSKGASVKVKVIAGGGGGGGCAITVAGQGSVGTGGAGGGYAESTFLISDLAATEQVTVGTGGAGGAAGNNGGVAGTDSSFSAGATLVQAIGGGGGAGGAPQAGPLALPTGVPGAAGTGQIKVRGSHGIWCAHMGAAGNRGGQGGSSGLGYGGVSNSSANNAAGVTGLLYGGGGSGGANNASQATGKAGGTGADGIVVVETYG